MQSRHILFGFMPTFFRRLKTRPAKVRHCTIQAVKDLPMFTRQQTSPFDRPPSFRLYCSLQSDVKSSVQQQQSLARFVGEKPPCNPGKLPPGKLHLKLYSESSGSFLTRPTKSPLADDRAGKHASILSSSVQQHIYLPASGFGFSHEISLIFDLSQQIN